MIKISSAIFKTFFLSLCIVANTHFAFGQTASILPPGYTQYLDSNGKPLSAGKVYNYIPSTTTPKTTWQDAGETIPNANPVILDAGGRAKILGDGSYRQIVKDRNNVTIWDAVTSSTGSGSSSPTATGDGDLVGTIKPWAGMTAPNQYAFTYGQEISRTTYSILYTAITSTQAVFCSSGSPTLTGLSDTTNFWIGMAVEVSCVLTGASTIISKTSNSVTLAVNANVSTNTNATFFPWGRGNGSTTFNLPDLRGIVPAGNNNMGGVASSNLNTTYFGATNPNSVGALGGSQSNTLIAINIPGHSHPVFLTDTGHAHAGSTISLQGASMPPNISSSVMPGRNDSGINVVSTPLVIASAVTGITVRDSPSGGGTANQTNYTGGGIAVSATIGVAGSGYTPGSQIITVAGGTCTTQPQFTVTISGGGVFSGTPALLTAGSCTVAPANPAATSGGGGTGGTLNVVYSAQPFSLIQPTRTTNYIIKITPDANSATASGVTSLGGMTGSIACGTGLTCTGNTISAASSAISISFTQTGTGAVATNLDILLRDKVFTPEMFADTPNSQVCGTGTDAGPAIQRAINAAGAVDGSVELGPCIYFVVTPIVDSFGVRLVGKNRDGTFISFSPAGNNQIAYRVRNAGNIVTGGGIENVFFYTNDTVLTKTAIELEDVSSYHLDNVKIGGNTIGLAAFWGGASNSIGLRIRGREFIRTNKVQIAADIPLQFSKNPNSTIDSDNSDYNNIGLTASATNDALIIDDALSLTRNSFNNLHIAGGINCINWNNTTGTVPSDGNTINNFGCEQGNDITGYNLYIHGNATGLIRGLTLSGYQTWDNSRNGASLRSIQNMLMSNIFYQALVTFQCLDTNNTVVGLSWRESLFQECSTASFGGMKLISAASLEVGTILPRWANYNTALSGNAFNIGRAATFPGSSSGLVTVVAQAAAGTPVISWPTATGTIVTTGTAGQIAVSATTGAASLINTAVTPNPYGSATASPTFTVDALGRLTAAANVTITPAIGSVTGLGTGVVTAAGNAVNTGGGLATQQTQTPNITDGSGAGLGLTVVQEGFQIGNMVHQLVAVTYPATADVSTAQLNGLAVKVPNRASAAQCWMTRQNGGFAIQIQPIINTANLLMFTAGGTAITNANLTTRTISFQCIYPAT